MFLFNVLLLLHNSVEEIVQRVTRCYIAYSGIFLHFILCTAVLLVGFVVFIAENFPPFYPYAMIGGASWASSKWWKGGGSLSSMCIYPICPLFRQLCSDIDHQRARSGPHHPIVQRHQLFDGFPHRLLRMVRHKCATAVKSAAQFRWFGANICRVWFKVEFRNFKYSTENTHKIKFTFMTIAK